MSVGQMLQRLGSKKMQSTLTIFISDFFQRKEIDTLFSQFSSSSFQLPFKTRRQYSPKELTWTHGCKNVLLVLFASEKVAVAKIVHVVDL